MLDRLRDDGWMVIGSGGWMVIGSGGWRVDSRSPEQRKSRKGWGKTNKG